MALSWSVEHKKKLEIASQPASKERCTYCTFSEMQITPKQEKEVKLFTFFN